MKQIAIAIIIILSIIPTVCSEPIHDAARLGNLELVQAELDKGVDINFKDSESVSYTHLTLPTKA